MTTTPTEKLQKVLARAGFAARREIEGWIAAGRITVNGRPAHVGQRVSRDDRILVDGRALASRRHPAVRRVLLYHKPQDEICTRSDPAGRPTVFDRLPPLKHGRWLGVGRLDINSSGLLLFTTDGELAHRLSHPRSRIEREYAVRVMGTVTRDMTRALVEGVTIDGHRCRFTDLRYYGGAGINRWYHVVIMEGRNREVRKLWESQGLKVSRLKRVRFGPLFLPADLRQGQFRELSAAEVDALLQASASHSAPGG